MNKKTIITILLALVAVVGQLCGNSPPRSLETVMATGSLTCALT